MSKSQHIKTLGALRESGYRPPQSEFIDGVTFDGRKPNDYLKAFAIGLKGDALL